MSHNKKMFLLLLLSLLFILLLAKKGKGQEPNWGYPFPELEWIDPVPSYWIQEYPPDWFMELAGVWLKPCCGHIKVEVRDSKALDPNVPVMVLDFPGGHWNLVNFARMLGEGYATRTYKIKIMDHPSIYYHSTISAYYAGGNLIDVTGQAEP